MSASMDSFKLDLADLLEEDGEPLESDWHRLAMTLLIDITVCYLDDRDDYFVGGNMFIYFDTKRQKHTQFRGPDYFLVWGVSPRPARKYWAVWQEGGQFPDLIIELGSPSTIKIDKTAKKRIYEKTFRTHEYFVYDPTTGELLGWRLENGRYQRIVPNEHSWLWCEELGLWLGTWQGRFQHKDGIFLRFFDRDGRLVPTAAEAQQLLAEAERQRAESERREKEAETERAEAEKQRAEAERREKEAERERADAEKQRAEAERREKEAERQRAETEKQRADAERLQKEAEKQRADAAEAELARLRAQQAASKQRRKKS